MIYLFHGLAGSTDSTYIHRTAILMQRQGHTVIMLNHRGCGEGSGLAKGPYHSGRAEDLSAAIEHGKKLFPRHRHLAIGFSLSGNALLLLLSGRRGKTKPDCAISVNAPIHLHSTALALKQGFNRVYDIKFFRQCRHDIFMGNRENIKKYKIPQLAWLHDFDNLYTAPAGGFENREDYYASCSTWNLLSEIVQPTIALTAADDPFVDSKFYFSAKPSSSVQVHIEKFGGHMGFIAKERTPLGNRRWLDYAILECVKALGVEPGD